MNGHFERYRSQNWTNPHAYVRCFRLDAGGLAPWAQLFDRPTQEVIGEPTPQTVVVTNLNGFEAYVGSLDPADVQEGGAE